MDIEFEWGRLTAIKGHSSLVEVAGDNLHVPRLDAALPTRFVELETANCHVAAADPTHYCISQTWQHVITRACIAQDGQVHAASKLMIMLFRQRESADMHGLCRDCPVPRQWPAVFE
nr:hypothetical protein [uncultured Massilia sp.]